MLYFTLYLLIITVLYILSVKSLDNWILHSKDFLLYG